MQKIFILSASALALVLLLWGVYAFFFKNNPYSGEVSTDVKTISQDTQPEQGSDVGGVDIFSGDTIKKVVDEAVLGGVFDEKGDTLWYVSLQPAAIKKTDVLSGTTSTIVDLSYTPTFVRWSPDKTKALIQEKPLGREQWHMIDLTTKTDTVLKEGVSTPVWTNIGDRIVYEYVNKAANIRSIDMADPDGKNWKTLADVPFTAPLILSAIPQTSLLAVWNLPGAFFETNLRTLSLAGGDFRTVFSGKFGTDYLFSPQGDRIAISSSDQKGGGKLMLGLANTQGGEYKTLGVPTLISKTAWSSGGKKIFYALPGDFPANSVLPDDYRGKPLLTQDTFWRVDVTTGEQERLVDLTELSAAYDATQLFLDPQEKYLFFVNRIDGRLYRIKL